MDPSKEGDLSHDGELEKADGAIKSKRWTPTATVEIKLSSDKDDFYNMQHKWRGKAIIINQMNFRFNPDLFREGSDVDERNLEEAFKKYGFEVHIFRDCLKDEINYILADKYSKDPNLADDDCIVICYLSHGEENEKLRTVKEREYITVQELLDPFTAEKCPQMAGKPKLVFIQACKGQKLDEGSTVQFDGKTDGQKTFSQGSFTIPNNADFFIAYSSSEGYMSLRDTKDGSWFIQCLCKQLNKEETQNMSIFQWMTKVNRMVAEQEDDLPLVNSTGRVVKLVRVKQASGFLSRLTKDLILKPKVRRRQQIN